MDNKVSPIAQYKQFSIFLLTKKLAIRHADNILHALDQIPLVGKHSKEMLLSGFKGKKIFHEKWEHSLIVFDSTGVFAGVVIGSEREKEDNNIYSKNCIYLNDFAISADFHKQGLGKFLIKTWVKYNQSTGFRELDGKLIFAVQTNSAEWNNHVQRLYESAGYKKVAVKTYDNRLDNVYVIDKI